MRVGSRYQEKKDSKKNKVNPLDLILWEAGSCISELSTEMPIKFNELLHKIDSFVFPCQSAKLTFFLKTILDADFVRIH